MVGRSIIPIQNSLIERLSTVSHLSHLPIFEPQVSPKRRRYDVPNLVLQQRLVSALSDIRFFTDVTQTYRTANTS